MQPPTSFIDGLLVIDEESLRGEIGHVTEGLIDLTIAVNRKTAYIVFDNKEALESLTMANLGWIKTIEAVLSVAPNNPVQFPVFLIPWKDSDSKHEAIMIQTMQRHGEIAFSKKSATKNVYTIWYTTQMAQAAAVTSSPYTTASATELRGWKIVTPVDRTIPTYSALLFIKRLSGTQVKYLRITYPKTLRFITPRHKDSGRLIGQVFMVFDSERKQEKALSIKLRSNNVKYRAVIPNENWRNEKPQ